MVSTPALGVCEIAAVRSVRLRTRAKRIAQIIIHTVVVWFAALLILPWLDRPRRDAAVARWAWRALTIFNVRVAVRGSPAQPTSPVMLVANHISWLDMYLMNAVQVSRFVAKSEVASVPVFGTIARQIGSIFIRRGSLRNAHRVKNEAAAAMRAGDVVGVFPEGTTSDGRRLRFFYPALFQAAIEAGATIQPIAIRYHHDDGTPNTAPAYTEEINLMRSIRAVLREPALLAEVTLCEPLLASRTRGELADRTRRTIAEALAIHVLPPRPRHLPGTWRRARRRRHPGHSIPSRPGRPHAQRPNTRPA
jgi:1-acyl-sn-glycerol-3-phosphate acyltransferase